MNPSATPAKILRIDAVLDRLGLSRSTLYERIRSGHMAPPIKLGPRASGWRESDVLAFIDRCERDSRGEKA